MTKRKNLAQEFKAKVALEAIREEVLKKYGVHATQISRWKRAAIENMASAFGRQGHDPDAPSTADIEKSHSKIGQLVWIQSSTATFDLKAASSSAMASSGVFHPRVLRGRWLI